MADENAKMDENKHAAMLGTTEDDGDLKPLKMDGSTEVLINIDHNHGEIHNGETFHVSKISPSLANSGIIDIVLQTGPIKESHCIFRGACGGDAFMRVYEAPSGVVSGEVLAVKNKNRIVGDGDNVVSALLNPNISYIGELLDEYLIPGGSGGTAGGGADAQRDEWPLAPNSLYLFRLRNMGGTAKNASLQVEWYEHTKLT